MKNPEYGFLRIIETLREKKDNRNVMYVNVRKI